MGRIVWAGEGTHMGGVDELRADLDASRAELLEAFEGITQEQFSRRPPGEVTEQDRRWAVRDVLWHVGLVEDWLRRVVDQGIAGRPVDRFQRRDRPAVANTPEYLREWLEQCRRPTLSLLRRLPEDALDREFTLPEGEVRTARRLLAYIARHEREHAEQVRALWALPPPPER